MSALRSQYDWCQRRLSQREWPTGTTLTRTSAFAPLSIKSRLSGHDNIADIGSMHPADFHPNLVGAIVSAVHRATRNSDAER